MAMPSTGNACAATLQAPQEAAQKRHCRTPLIKTLKKQMSRRLKEKSFKEKTKQEKTTLMKEF